MKEKPLIERVVVLGRAVLGKADSTTAERVSGVATIALCTLLPTLLLFIPKVGFYVDWANVEFIAGYQSESLRTLGHFSSTINTAEVLGMPFPIFYGPIFFRICAIPTLFFGADVGVRSIIMAAFFAQAAALWLATQRLRASLFVRITICACVSLEIYPITNLYNRSDICELVSVLMVVSAIALWNAQILWMRQERSCPIWLVAWCALSMTIAAGTHAITAALGGPLFFLIATMSMLAESPESRRQHLLSLALVGAGFLSGVLPLFTAVISEPQLGLTKYIQNLNWIPYSIDSITGRLSPSPIDLRSLAAGTVGVSTPYLESTVDISLIALALISIVRSRSLYAIAAIAVAAAITALSTTPGPWFGLIHVLGFVQFAYRLTSYVDILLLTAIFWSYLYPAPAGAKHRLFGTVVCTFALTASCLNYETKIIHATTAMQPFDARTAFSSPEGGLSYIHNPPIFYGAGDYSSEGPSDPLVPTLEPKPAEVPPIQLSHFGQTGPFVIAANQQQLIFTRIQIFPWTRIWVDGHILETKAIRRYYVEGLGNCAAFVSKHRTALVSFETIPSTFWSLAMKLAFVVLLIEAGAMLYPLLPARIRARFT